MTVLRALRAEVSNARANSSAEAKRSAGTGARACWSTTSAASGTAGRERRTEGACPLIILAIAACAVGPLNGGSPGEHLICDGTKAVHVGAGPDVALASSLLGAHVLRRADHHAAPGETLTSIRQRHIERPRDPEISDECAPVMRKQHIFGLDIAMYDPVLVGVLERRRHLSRDADGFVKRQLMLPPEPVAEALAVHVHHREPELAGGGLARIEHRQDVRMLEPRGDTDLAPEPLRA